MFFSVCCSWKQSIQNEFRVNCVPLMIEKGMSCWAQIKPQQSISDSDAQSTQPRPPPPPPPPPGVLKSADTKSITEHCHVSCVRCDFVGGNNTRLTSKASIWEIAFSPKHLSLIHGMSSVEAEIDRDSMNCMANQNVAPNTDRKKNYKKDGPCNTKRIENPRRTHGIECICVSQLNGCCSSGINHIRNIGKLQFEAFSFFSSQPKLNVFEICAEQQKEIEYKRHPNVSCRIRWKKIGTKKW